MSQPARKPGKPGKTAASRTAAASKPRTAAASKSSAKSRPSTGDGGGGGGRKLSLSLLVVALVGVLALAAVSLLSDSDSSDSAPSGSGNEAAGEQPEPDAELLALARRDKSDPYARGAADAPVVMIEYSDFQCPFCGKFARDTKPSLVRKYVDEGVLRIEWRQFPIFGKESENAARASWAAGRQGKFWQFHDVAFGEERKKNSGAFSRDGVEQMAKEAGVEDLAKFAEDMKSADATAALREDMNEGYGLGVSSTPAFLVNGTPVLGAQSAEYFEQTVERARKQAERADAPTTPPADEPDSDERDSDERDADEPDAGGAP